MELPSISETACASIIRVDEISDPTAYSSYIQLAVWANVLF